MKYFTNQVTYLWSSGFGFFSDFERFSLQSSCFQGIEILKMLSVNFDLMVISFSLTKIT